MVWPVTFKKSVIKISIPRFHFSFPSKDQVERISLCFTKSSKHAKIYKILKSFCFPTTFMIFIENLQLSKDWKIFSLKVIVTYKLIKSSIWNQECGKKPINRHWGGTFLYMHGANTDDEYKSFFFHSIQNEYIHVAAQ